MKTIESSYFKLFIHKNREKQRGVCGFRQEIGFLVHRKLVGNGLSVKCCHSVSAVSSPQTYVAREEIQTISSDQPKTVHVRFKLHKECAFGQQFLLVGDDPIIGLWDPSDGVPLDWSDGHVWTTEVDLPSGKVIKYKFILKGNNGMIAWQNGPDRILETWDTEKTISVSEDWDNPQLQNVVEEEHVNEESLINSDLLIFPEKSNQTIVEEGNINNDHTNHLDEASLVMVAENISEELREQHALRLNDEKPEESSSLEDRTSLVMDEGLPVLVPGLVPILPVEAEEVNEVENNIFENATSESEANDVNKVENNVVEEKNSEELREHELHLNDEKQEESSSLENRTRLVMDERLPVLVPGLVPKLPVEEDVEADEVNKVENDVFENATSESEAKDVNKVENNVVENRTIEFDEIEEPELSDEHGAGSLHSIETSKMMMVDEKQQICVEDQQRESNVFEINIEWGRRTLRKFLANLGLI